MFFAITGASQGLGQAISVSLAKTAATQSYFLLISRNEQGLQNTRSMMLDHTQNEIFVETCAKDLSHDFDLTTIFDDVKSKKSFTEAVLIHNAGSLGDVSKYIYDYDNSSEVRQYFDLNISSVTCLTSTFLTAFSCKLNDNVKKRVVNISSLRALEPGRNLGLYCAGKAARDMLFRVLALEEPSVRVLNYAPGPLQGDMMRTLMSQLKDDESRNMCISLHETNQLVDMYDTASKLVQLLKEDKYQSGAHIDYFDELPT